MKGRELLLLPSVQLLTDNGDLSNIVIAFVAIFAIILPAVMQIVFIITAINLKKKISPTFFRGWLQYAISVASELCSSYKLRFFFWGIFDLLFNIAYTCFVTFLSPIFPAILSFLYAFVTIFFWPSLTPTDNILLISEPIILGGVNILTYLVDFIKWWYALIIVCVCIVPNILCFVFYFIQKDDIVYLKRDLTKEMERSTIEEKKKIFNSSPYDVIDVNYIGIAQSGNSFLAAGGDSYEFLEFLIEKTIDELTEDTLCPAFSNKVFDPSTVMQFSRIISYSLVAAYILLYSTGASIILDK